MRSLYLCAALLALQCIVLTPRLRAQSGASASEPTGNSADTISTAHFTPEFLWTEQFSGSANSEGRVTSLDSTLGYVFSRNFGVDAGLPVYFVHGTIPNDSGAAVSTSNNGIGDGYAQLRFSFPTPLLNYKTVLTGTVPTGSTANGLSTGHPTYDWTNHFDRAFGRWTPFAEAGIGNSIPSDFIFNRPYASYGHEAHVQAGAEYQVLEFLGLSVSGYDLAPWGSQTIFSRVVTKGTPPPGAGGRGPVFGQANQTTGGAGIAADSGFSVGADISPGSLVDFSLGYSHSVQLNLDTFSFGIGVNMSRLLRRVRSGS